MKIGILTFHRSINYGAFIQCLSLSHELKKRYPDEHIEVIDYASKKKNDKYFRINYRQLIRRPAVFFKENSKKKKFLSSLNLLPLSQKCILSDNEEEAYSYINKNYDIVIVGSDAVWNWIERGFPNPYLLNISGNIKKFSYAASAYGMPEDRITSEQLEYCRKAFDSYRFIGVRDGYTLKLVQRSGTKTVPVYTCDPTVFLDMDYVDSLIRLPKTGFREYFYNKYKLDKNKKIIAFMTINKDLVTRISNIYKNEYNLVSIHNYNYGNVTNILDQNPLEWAAAFRLFELTVTSYFHGTLLSLRNNTPVISIDHTEFSKNYTGKIEDILTRLDMRSNFFLGGHESCTSYSSVISRVKYILENRESEKKKISDNMDILVRSSESFFKELSRTVDELKKSEGIK